jgi:hypothetical protein
MRCENCAQYTRLRGTRAEIRGYSFLRLPPFFWKALLLIRIPSQVEQHTGPIWGSPKLPCTRLPSVGKDTPDRGTLLSVLRPLLSFLSGSLAPASLSKPRAQGREHAGENEGPAGHEAARPQPRPQTASTRLPPSRPAGRQTWLLPARPSLRALPAPLSAAAGLQSQVASSRGMFFLKALSKLPIRITQHRRPRH